MAVYVAIASALFLLALLEVGARTRSWATIALVIVTAFAALRFETGFDWMPYEAVFDQAPTIAGAARNETPDFTIEQLYDMEQLYVLINSVVRTFSDNVVVLFAMVAIFAIVTIHQVTGRISRSQCLVWLVYFCLVFLAVQMSAIRSAMASSIVLIGLMLSAQQRPIAGSLLIAVATGFHSAVAIFLPLPLLRNWRPSNGLIALIVGLGLAARLLGVQPIDPLINLLSHYLPFIAAGKLISFYRGLEPAPISIGTYILILGQLSLLFVLCRSSGEKDRRDPFIIIAIWLTLMMLSAHLLLAGFPAIWNRIMYVALPWQIASLCRTEAFIRLGLGARRLVVCGLGSISMAGLVYFLVSPASLPFIPYQSVVEVWLSGDSGDGRERSLQWYFIVGNPAATRIEQ